MRETRHSSVQFSIHYFLERCLTCNAVLVCKFVIKKNTPFTNITVAFVTPPACQHIGRCLGFETTNDTDRPCRCGIFNRARRRAAFVCAVLQVTISEILYRNPDLWMNSIHRLSLKTEIVPVTCLSWFWLLSGSTNQHIHIVPPGRCRALMHERHNSLRRQFSSAGLIQARRDTHWANFRSKCPGCFLMVVEKLDLLPHRRSDPN